MGSPLATMHKLLFLASLVSAAPQQRPFTSQDIQANYQSPQQNYMDNMYRDEVPVYREQDEPKIEKRQTAAYGPGPKYVEKEVPQPFQYEYGVKDDYSGNAFAKTETQNDLGQVQGSYKVNLPDGRVQTVTYNADHEGGFVAEVTYEGGSSISSCSPRGIRTIQGSRSLPWPRSIHQQTIARAVIHHFCYCYCYHYCLLI